MLERQRRTLSSPCSIIQMNPQYHKEFLASYEDKLTKSFIKCLGSAYGSSFSIKLDQGKSPLLLNNLIFFSFPGLFCLPQHLVTQTMTPSSSFALIDLHCRLPKPCLTIFSPSYSNINAYLTSHVCTHSLSY